MSGIDSDGVGVGVPLLTDVVDVLAEGVLVVGSDQSIQLVNPSAARLLGLSAGVVGAYVREALPPHVDGERLLAMLAVDGPRRATLVTTPHGYDQHLLVERHDVDGGRTVLLITDQTDVVDARDHLGMLATQLSSLQTIGRVGLWSWDPHSDTMEWSEGMYALHGVDPIDFRGTLAWACQFVDPEHRERLQGMLVDVAGSGGSSSLAVPVVRADGVRRWVDVRAEHAGSATADTVVGVYQDITQLQLTIRTLREANGRLERIRAVLAHDVQTPLTAVKGFAHLLAQELDGQHLKMVERMAANAQSAIDITRSVLQTAVEGGGTGAMTTFPLARVVTWVVDRLDDQVAQVSGLVVADVPDDLPAVYSVEEVARQVLFNLVTNSIKYRRPDLDLQVRITAAPASDELVVQVGDNGRGIAAEDREHVFQSGYRSSSHPEVDGAGFGLAAVRDMLADLGQQVWIASTGEEGTTFAFTLPTAVDGVDSA